MPAQHDELRFESAKRPRKGAYRDCAHCGQQFYLPPSRIKRGEKYCSRRCLKAATPAPTVEKICPVCNQPFTVRASIADRYTVCSRECRLANTQYQPCKRCGRLFPNSEKRYARHYCSEECRRPPIVVQCTTCGKDFRRLPGDTNRRFCSFSCYRLSQPESSLEKPVRKGLAALSIPFQQEAQIGRYCLDFYLPAYRLAVEVDGAYWHRNRQRETRRTTFLQRHGITILRISEAELAAIDPTDLLRGKLATIIPDLS